MVSKRQHLPNILSSIALTKFTQIFANKTQIFNFSAQACSFNLT